MGMAVLTVLAGHLDAHMLGAVSVGTNVWLFDIAIVSVIGVMLALPPSVAQLDGAGGAPRWAAVPPGDLARARCSARC